MSEWRERRLDEFASWQGGFAFPSNWFVGDHDGVPIVRMSNLKAGKLDLTEAERVHPEVSRRFSQFSLQPGDFLLGMSGSLSNNAVVTESDLPSLLNQRVGRLVKKSSEADYGYLSFQLRSSAFGRHVDREAAGAAQLNISSSQIERFVFACPNEVSEQHRIAEILSTVDEAIEQTEALIAKTQQIKAGLMHDLFTRGVTEHGNLRPPREEAPQLYKESMLGWIPKEWEIVRLNEVGAFTNGLNKSKEQFGHGTKFVNISDVYPEVLDVRNLGRMETTASERSRYGLIPGDILLDRSSVKLEGVGYPTLYSGSDEDVVFCGFIIRYRMSTDRIHPSFALHAMRFEDFRRWVFRIATVSANVNVNQQALGGLVLALPSFPEQERIVEVIAAKNRTLFLEDAKVEKLRSLKYGLMQDLLTGRVRVRTYDTMESEARDV